MQKDSFGVPPRFGTYLLKKIYGRDMYDEISGDFIEVYQQRIADEGHFFASVKYIRDAILSFRNIDLKNKNSIITNNNIGMIQNYFKMAFRVLQKHPTTSLINILGLAVGMGVCLIIYQYIHFEKSFDQFFSNVANTYRVTIRYVVDGEPQQERIPTNFALGVQGGSDIPEIEKFTRLHPQYGGAVVSNPEKNQPYTEDDMLFVEDNFLEVFDFSMLYGTRATALSDKNNIVITQEIATKYFGTNDPLGKTLKVSGGWAAGDFIIAGVLDKLPNNSHLQFDFLMPIKKIIEENEQYKGSDGWGWNNFITYVTLAQGSDINQVVEKYNHIVADYDTDLSQSSTIANIGLQPVTDIHLKSAHLSIDPVSNNGSIRDVKIFSVIAFIILIIAWVNYINLSTARSINRAKEVGIRKSIGAFRKQLIGQFMVEAGVVNSLSAVLAIGIAIFMLPILNNIIGRQLELNVLHDLDFWLGFSGLIIIGAVLSGLYPAFILSSFRPASMLGSVKKAAKGGFNMRKSLIVFQFFTSVLLISGTYLVYNQISFMKSQELGIDMEKILVLNGPRVNVSWEEVETKMQTFKNGVTNHHSISAACGSGSVPGKSYNWGTALWKLGESEETAQSGSLVYTDRDFTDTYDFTFLAGRGFTEMVTDERGVLINEEAVKAYGLGTPKDAINQKLNIAGVDTVTVLGVLENFHWSSLKDAHTPYLFDQSNSTRYISFKMDLSDIQASLAHIEANFNQVFPGNPFNYFFLDDDFNNQYRADLQFGNLFTAFSVLAIFISCLGLFGLVAFSTNARIKEIGVRKALGASVSNLMLLLSKEYVKLLLIANLLAVPVILYWGQVWLDGYAYKIDLGIGTFAVPGLILIVISLLTVSYKTYSTAKSNPVNALKVE